MGDGVASSWKTVAGWGAGGAGRPCCCSPPSSCCCRAAGNACIVSGLSTASRPNTSPGPALTKASLRRRPLDAPVARRAAALVAALPAAWPVCVSSRLAGPSPLFVRTLVDACRWEELVTPSLLVFQLDPSTASHTELLDFHAQVLRGVAALPGVRSASMFAWGLLAGSRTSDGVRGLAARTSRPISTTSAPHFFDAGWVSRWWPAVT